MRLGGFGGREISWVDSLLFEPYHRHEYGVGDIILQEQVSPVLPIVGGVAALLVFGKP